MLQSIIAGCVVRMKVRAACAGVSVCLQSLLVDPWWPPMGATRLTLGGGDYEGGGG